MKRLYVIICSAVLLVAILNAQNGANNIALIDNLKQANQMYKQGHYSDAAKLYESELKKGESAELYYNLGNCYYKSDELGNAILNYKRALRLSPNFDDAKYNLAIAESKIVDNVNSTPTFFIKRWINSLVEYFSSNQWVILSLILFIGMLATFLLFILSSDKNRRKISFFTSTFLGILFIITFIFAGARKEEFIKHNDAIIMLPVISVKSSPDKSGTDLFQLHEGTHVRVKSTLGNWSEVTLENGAVGWVEENSIARI